MRHTPGLLLIATVLLKGVHTFPTDNGTPYLFDPDQPTEYSLDELNTLFDAKESVALTKPKRQVDKTLATNVDTVSSTVHQSLAAASNINLFQSAELKYFATCPGNLNIEDTFTFDVIYNGRDVTFKGVPRGNIDGWGKVYVDPIFPRKPFYTRVSFHHATCKPVSPKKVCAFYFAGIATADIVYYGKNPGITPNAVQPDLAPNNVYVTAACNETPGSNGKIPCPAPTGPQCQLSRIFVTKI